MVQLNLKIESNAVEVIQTKKYSVVVVKATTNGGSKPVAAVAKVADNKKKEEKEEEDDDLFGEDSVDDVKAKKELQEKMKAEKDAKPKKETPRQRTLMVFEVKPYDEETDLEALCKNIKSLTHVGIQNWGAEHKFVPVAFGKNDELINFSLIDNYYLKVLKNWLFL